MSYIGKMTDKKRTLIFINILISCIASSMLATALTTALPPIMEDLQISVTTGQWLTSGYSLAMGIMMPLTAFLITRFPTKNLYLAGMGLFIVGLAVCVIAPGFYVMMCGRILQACGNGILTSMAQVILLTIYPIEKKGTVMGWYGLSVGAAPGHCSDARRCSDRRIRLADDLLCGDRHYGGSVCIRPFCL